MKIPRETYRSPFILTSLLALFGCGDSSSSEAVPSPEPVPDPPEAFSGGITLNHGGLEREAIVHIPEDTPANAPLIIVMHGYSSQASVISDYSGFIELANRERFIVAFPQGTIDADGYAFFNVGYAFHDDVEVDDLGFIRSLVEYLQREYAAHRAHVFATGMSNGGDMSFYLACQASDLFLAYAPIAGTMMKHISDNCAPGPMQPIMAVNGTADDVTFYNGDPNNQGGWGAYLDIPSIVEFWTTRHNLSLVSAEELPNTAPNDGSTVSLERYGTGNLPDVFRLYRVNNGGHDWPGVWGNMDLQTTNEVWDFFQESIDGAQ